MKRILSKEAIEQILSDKFGGANEFFWDNGSVTFNHDEEKIDDRDYEIARSKDIISILEHNIDMLAGRLEQAERSFNNVLKHFVGE